MKKLIALLLAIVMVISLVACGGDTDSQPTAEGTEAAEATEATKVTEAAESLTNAERYPLDTNTTLRVLFTDDGTGETVVSELWEEVTGVTTEVLSWSNEQLLTALAAGDIPDAIVLPWDLSKNVVYEYGQAGKFIDFSQYLNQMPNLSAMIEKYPEIMDICTYPDGGMYSLPKIQWTPTAQGNVLYIRTDVMEELGWEEAPATTDEFLQFIKEAQAKYGAEDPEFVAFHCRDNSYMRWNTTSAISTYFFPSFGELIETGLTLDSEGNVVLGAATEQYKHYLEFMNEVWESGAFETEIYTLDATAGRATIEEFHSAVSSGTHAGKSDASVEYGQNDVTVLEPLTSEYQTEKQWMKAATVNYVGCVGSTNCEDIDTLIQWLDSFYAPESDPLNEEGTVWGTSFFIGELGVHWSRDEEAKTYENISGGTVGYTTANGTGEFGYVNSGSIYVKAYGTLTKLLPYAVEKSGIDNLTLSEDDQDTYADIWTDLETYISQMHGKFITGEEDIEVGWDAYIKNLEKMDLPELLEIYQNAYDTK